MQGLVLQLTRAGFLMLLWLFIWSVLRILRTDIYAPTGAVMVRRGLTLRGTLLPSRQRLTAARYLVAILQTLFLAGDIWGIILPNAAVLAAMATENRYDRSCNRNP